MSNSSLVTYKKISPNKTSPRKNDVYIITPHCYVGQCNVQDMAAWLCNSSAQASANYGIGKDGEVGMFVEEKDRSWCSSSSWNDNRAITIECASDTTDPYKINDKVYNTLIKLMTDICQRYGKTKLIWFGDKDSTINYSPQPDEMLISCHRWFANKACPGDYIYNRLGRIANEVTAALSGIKPAPVDEKYYRVRVAWDLPETQLGAFIAKENAIANCPSGYSVFDNDGKLVYENNTVTVVYPSGIPDSKEDFINKVSAIAIELYKETGILPSVVTAQCILETGFGLGSDSTELVQRNNLLGMKTDLINNTWSAYTVWDGRSFTKTTPEYYNGKLTYIRDQFRVYENYERCIRDYEQFLLNVQNAYGYKYRKISGMVDPEQVITTISQGGYATDPNYIKSVMRIINEYNLTKYDEMARGIITPEPEPEPDPIVHYVVQVGSFLLKSNATKMQLTLASKMIDSIIKKEGLMYKVQVGDYLFKQNAEFMLEKLNDLKINAIIKEVVYE